MQYVVGAVARFPRRLKITNASSNQPNLPVDAGEVGFLTRRKIVKHRHLMTAAHKFVDHIRANEARTTCHKVAHSIALLGCLNNRNNVRQQ
jgi:hypothetical protein